MTVLKLLEIMFSADALKRSLPAATGNVNEITIDVISEVQKDLTTYDITSLVFLLYDTPETALQRLTLLQRVARNVDGKDLNLLHEWAVHRQNDSTWKQEFLEALAACQLYSVIRKLGFDVSWVKNTYRRPNPLDTDFLNPMKKALYNLCETLNTDNVTKLKKSLTTFNINVSEYDSCELILLELMCQKFITVRYQDCHVQKLISIIKHIPGLLNSAEQLHETQNYLNRERSVFQAPATSSRFSTPKNKYQQVSTQSETAPIIDSDKFNGNFKDTFENLAELAEKCLNINLKTDASKSREDSYQIKNPDRVGMCYIINQEKFHPSSESISHQTCDEPLEDRHGSTLDKNALTYTMEKLHFHVETVDDLAHQEILPSIKDIIQKKVQPNDSIFVLCILSHGIEGHVYGVDSVPIKVQDIQDLLDSKDARILLGKPKVLLIQACQVIKNKPALRLISDGPSKPHWTYGIEKYNLKKADFLICWATAPEYEAWRDDKKGSVFIQMLCSIILKRARHEHLHDIFTKTTDAVVKICALKNCAQIPQVTATLRKKLYLCLPGTEL